MQFLATSSINKSMFNFNSNYLILGLQQASGKFYIHCDFKWKSNETKRIALLG